jgi:hypothetical protein
MIIPLHYAVSPVPFGWVLLETPVLSLLESILLGAVVGTGLVVGIEMGCWVRPNRDFKTS